MEKGANGCVPRTKQRKGDDMIPPELSAKLNKVFQEKMQGKLRWSERACTNWLYSDDLKHAVDAVGEAALRDAQEGLS